MTYTHASRAFIRSIQFFVITLFASMPFLACSNDDEDNSKSPQIAYQFASADEGKELMQNHTVYYTSLSQNDIDWRMKKDGATLDELKTFALMQIKDFSEEEKQLINNGISKIESRLSAMGVSLPFPSSITFVKTTMQEESEAGAYTQKMEIYLGENLLTRILQSDSSSNLNQFSEILAHEIFHCLTRNNAEFRRKMYKIIGFTILPDEITFPDKIKDWILTNPDVERIDNYATFTINGKETKCELIVLYTKSWAEALAETGDADKTSFFEFNKAVLVPLDENGQSANEETYYEVGDIRDSDSYGFWAKVGKNTDYVFAPEECMADNFSYAIIRGEEGIAAGDFETPKIISDIISVLKKDYAK